MISFKAAGPDPGTQGELDRDRSGNSLERLLICVEGHRQEKILL